MDEPRRPGMDDMRITTRDLCLRKVGGHYMLVLAHSDDWSEVDVFSLNPTAAELWKRASEAPCTPRELSSWLGARYGLSAETVLPDVLRQLDEWEKYGLISRK